MGKGSYLGGSTIVSRSDRDKEEKIEERDRAFLDPRWRAKKKNRLNDTQSPAEQFLQIVLDNERRGTPLAPVPKNLRRYLPNVEDNEESIKKWAVSHPRYRLLKNKNKNK
ncbi:hypothetical protein A28LD_0381 [Idiomarina sp. A28L]|uniref:hypothetical protein n=1 Tax=Idiomarina sp. A28L TaxID=1036674 RepID=UPI0002138A7E|nr:hypothetical protein [Idiomarina sp. A28L]EGN75893.1 hypothetical protein A28LD_0381 [Idiomarina sp. A28L]